MPLFGPVHLAMLALIVVWALTLVWLVRAHPELSRPLRLALGGGLAVNELIWWGYRYSHEGFRFPEGLPLQLCDVTVWLTVIACLRRSTAATEFLYYAGLGGAGLALLMPDLWAPFPSYPSIYFFLAHGGVVAGTAMLIFGRVVPMRPGSAWRAFGWVNLYAAMMGVFNWIFGTNYLYLCRKPESASLLDLFGPWPIYLLVAEGFALGLFWLMSLALPNSEGYAPRHPTASGTAA
jgi:hypothetical integral membrane protein (TIGR02206 family)